MNRYEFSFSSSAEFVTGVLLLVVTIVAIIV